MRLPNVLRLCARRRLPEDLRPVVDVPRAAADRVDQRVVRPGDRRARAEQDQRVEQRQMPGIEGLDALRRPGAGHAAGAHRLRADRAGLGRQVDAVSVAAARRLDARSPRLGDGGDRRGRLINKKQNPHASSVADFYVTSRITC